MITEMDGSSICNTPTVSQRSVVALLTDPDQFFAQACQRGASGPFLVVTAAALVNMLSILVILFRFAGTLPRTARTLATVSYGIGIVVAFLSIYIGWIGVSVLLYGVATAYSEVDTPPFRLLFRLTGWGYVPSILAGAVTAAAAYIVYYWRMILPADPSQLSTAVAGVAGSPVFTVSHVLQVVFTLWQGFFWVFAVRHASGESFRDSTLVAAVSTAFILVIQLFLG